MQQLIRHRLLSEASRKLQKSPAVAILGARQVGKTTLARQLAADHPAVTFFDLERAADHAALSARADTLLGQCQGLVVIDEVQRLPHLFETLRPLCDREDSTTRFLLLGSASWDLVRGVSETLAGRVQFVDMSGFSIAEVGAGHLLRLWLRGGFPAAFCAASNADAAEWHEAFARTFLERDVPALGLRVAPETLRRFWTMLAHYHGQIWNASRLAQSLDSKRSTVDNYRDLLAGTFMLRVLPPWFENLGKRLVKSPKVYLRDSGILHGLLQIGSVIQLASHPAYGASWEGFALEQTLIAHGGRDAYFYATQRGAELDLLLLRNGKRWGFEFKSTDAPRTTRSMHIAMQDLQLEHLWVVYPGNLSYPMTDGITALPLAQIDGLNLT
jgi:predicted AAA+ superfamily ATPase